MDDQEVVVVTQPNTDTVVVVADTPIVGVTETAREVVDLESPVFVTVDTKTQEQVVVSAGEQGPQGVPGVDSDATGLLKKQYTAGATLSGHRVVKMGGDGRVVYADQSTLYDADILLGVTLNAANEDDPVVVHLFGEAEEVSWSWTIHGSIYLGVNGLLTQTAPTSGALVRVGHATGTDSMFVDIDNPIYLA